MRLVLAIVLALSVSAFADSVHVLLPEADAGVDATWKDSCIGLTGSIPVKTNSNQKGYFRFDLSGLSGTITYLKFRVYHSSIDSGMSLNVKLASDAWREDSMTFNNQPAPVAGAVLGTQVITTFGWGVSGSSEFVITPAAVADAAADKKLSLQIYMTGTLAPIWTDIFSKERAIIPNRQKPSLICSTSTKSGISSRTRVAPASGFTMRTIADGIVFLLGAPNSGLEIYDLQGRLVRSWPAKSFAVRWNVKGTASGNYIAVLRNKDALVTEPIRIAR